MPTAIDLSNLPKPDVVEVLSFEELRDAGLADLIARDSEMVNLLQSDPAYKNIEVGAYRELLVRQHINDAAHANMLPYAKKADLDNLVANFKVFRLVVNAGDPAATPPVDPTYESDEALLERALLSHDGYTTAGSEESYQFHALSADGQVKSVSVVSPNPCYITITVLSHTDDGAADAPLLSLVEQATTDKTVRPLGDRVTVQTATIITYTINATLTVYAGADQSTTQANAESALGEWVTAQHKIGRDITVAGIHAALKVEGVHDITLNNTVGTDITANQVVTDAEAAYCSGVTVTVGGVGE